MRTGRTADRRLDGRAATIVNVRFALTAALVVGAAVLGGASRENPLRLAAVELAAIPLLFISLRHRPSGRDSFRPMPKYPLTLLALILCVPLLQLIPLPARLWTALPGQAPRLEALRLAKLATPWLPLSLAPDNTWRMALGLVAPAAMWVATLDLRTTETRRLVWLWIALAAGGLVLGLAQLATPAGGPAYLYRTTNLGSLVGLFANRNHEAGFLLALLPFSAALAVPAAAPAEPDAERRGRRWSLWLGLAFVAVSVVALGVIHSRAGVVLAIPAILASLAVLWRGAGWWTDLRPAIALAATIAVAAGSIAILGLSPILDRFRGQGPEEFRLEAWPYVIEAARSFLPLGSGLGSFDRVFEAAEPLTLVGPTYFNHAHNDYLELWLETGWVGAAIFCAFLVWFAPAALRAWRSGGSLACAASATILLVMAQSVVDYPLRTETLAVLFAFCCGLLAAPQGRAGI